MDIQIKGAQITRACFPPKRGFFQERHQEVRGLFEQAAGKKKPEMIRDW